MPGEGPPFAADAPVGVNAPVARALAAKQAITDLGNVAPPPNRRLYRKMGRDSHSPTSISRRSRAVAQAANLRPTEGKPRRRLPLSVCKSINSANCGNCPLGVGQRRGRPTGSRLRGTPPLHQRHHCLPRHVGHSSRLTPRQRTLPRRRSRRGTRLVHFFSRKASVKAWSPGAPFSIARMARPPLA